MPRVDIAGKRGTGIFAGRRRSVERGGPKRKESNRAGLCVQAPAVRRVGLSREGLNASSHRAYRTERCVSLLLCTHNGCIRVRYTSNNHH